jgi:hypothetical protein
MGGDAIYIGRLYTKDQIIGMYAETKRKYNGLKLGLEMLVWDFENIQLDQENIVDQLKKLLSHYKDE